jgi:hypothetical protein
MERKTFNRFVLLIGAAGSRHGALRLVASAAPLGGAVTFQGGSAKSRRKKHGDVRAVQRFPEVCQFRPEKGHPPSGAGALHR